MCQLLDIYDLKGENIMTAIKLTAQFTALILISLVAILGLVSLLRFGIVLVFVLAGLAGTHFVLDQGVQRLKRFFKESVSNSDSQIDNATIKKPETFESGEIEILRQENAELKACIAALAGGSSRSKQEQEIYGNRIMIRSCLITSPPPTY